MESTLQQQIQERFSTLPPVVQKTIESAEVEAHLRQLASQHKLHVDQWELLENEVVMTLLGFAKTADLTTNIEKSVGTDRATAESLASDISKIVFEPIRQELERELQHPEAVEKKSTDVEQMRTQMLSKSESTTPTVVPATPPTPAPEKKIERAPAVTTYAPATPSHERKGIEGDPYREQIV